jgi:hypothetical protein
MSCFMLSISRSPAGRRLSYHALRCQARVSGDCGYHSMLFVGTICRPGLTTETFRHGKYDWKTLWEMQIQSVSPLWPLAEE